MHRLRFGLTALFVFAASCRNGGTEDLLADLGLSDAEASCLTREYEAFGLDIATVLRADNETDLTADDVDALREVNQYCAGVGSDATAAPSTREPDEETDRESDAAESAPPEQTFLNDAYGDDPYLDSLYDACADGDMLACDDLYGWAPFGSDYEAFARICGGRRTEAWVEACVTEFGSG